MFDGCNEEPLRHRGCQTFALERVQGASKQCSIPGFHEVGLRISSVRYVMKLLLMTAEDCRPTMPSNNIALSRSSGVNGYTAWIIGA
jgi:hypothetical protein